MERSTSGLRDLPTSLSSRAGWAEYFELQRTSEPHLHQIEPTNHCPYSCIMCPRPTKMTRPPGHMDMGLYRKVIDEVADYSEPVRSKEIELFHFGESLLHPDFPEMVGYASAKGLNTQISTKAFLLKPELADRILENQPGRLIVSLDGYDQASCRHICGPNAEFAEAVVNIEHLIRARMDGKSKTHVLIRIIKVKANEDRTESFKKEWEEKGIPVEIRTFFPWGEQDLTDLGEYDQYPPYLPCPFPWQYLVVQWNGDVVPCCRDYNATNKLGNVKERTLKDIWNGPAADHIREQLRTGNYGDNETCRRCMAIYYTEGTEGAAHPEGDDLAGVWKRAVTAHGEAPYLIDDADGSHFSYSDADRVISGLMHRLRADGVEPGDRVLLWAPIHVEAILLFWAAVQVGAVVVPLDPDMPSRQAREIVSRVSPSLALVDAQRRERLGATTARVIVLDAAEPPPPGATPLSEWLTEEDLEADPGAPAGNLARKPAVIVFTSGTTGRQKGVVLAHQALANSGRLMARTYEWSPRDVLMSTGDLHTMSGLRNPCVAAVQAGSAVVVASADVRRSPLALAECVERHRATLLVTVPAALRQFLLVGDRLSPGALAGLRCVLSTADRLPEQLRADFDARFRVPVMNYYGLTETAGLCAGELPDTACAGRATIGHPIDALFRLVDENGRDVKDDGAGELWIQSANLMLGYYDDPDATGAAFAGPWYRTGDLARRNADGSYSLVGRLRDILKNTHGEIVSAAEVEDALLAHPDVADAGACTTSGPAGQERMLAFVVPTPKAVAPNGEARWLAGLRRHLLERLGPKKLPAEVSIRERLPRNSNGKILTALLLEVEPRT